MVASGPELFHPKSSKDKLDKLIDYAHDIADSLDQIIGTLERIANAVEASDQRSKEYESTIRQIGESITTQLAELELPEQNGEWLGHGDP